MVNSARIMGIVNVTPDSFSDGGRTYHPDVALKHAMALIDAGADCIDLGGESSRPGAKPISLQEELDRVMPVIEAFRKTTNHPLSIDTTKPEVMRAALAAGADMINDIHALMTEGALEAVATSTCDVILMHKQGKPSTMQRKPAYEQGVLASVISFFESRIQACEQAGIARDRLYLDPGFGFGKTLTHNLTLLANLSELKTFGLPIVIGLSRKSMLGQVVDRPVENRLSAGLAATVYAVMQGAKMIRTHDVAETRDALMMIATIEGNRHG